jgi:hypothetical protein
MRATTALAFIEIMSATCLKTLYGVNLNNMPVVTTMFRSKEKV